MAMNAFDEAIRNIVCVGGDPAHAAVLDNFCWGGVEDPNDLGTLVRACQACYDAAIAYGAPFISGKDSLNNQFALGAEDAPRLIQALQEMAARPGPDAEALRAILPRIEQRIRSTGRIAVPPTLLISSLAIVPDVSRSVTSDLKPDGGDVWLVGGLPQVGFDLRAAAQTHAAMHACVREGLVRACQDVSEGGWLAALAEMAIGGRVGVQISAPPTPGPFAELAAAYVVQFVGGVEPEKLAALTGSSVGVVRLGAVSPEAALQWGTRRASLEALSAAWRSLAR
jgi:phosphoribosylformylglycinamidine (FGAM) synthase-like enzyme